MSTGKRDSIILTEQQLAAMKGKSTLFGPSLQKRLSLGYRKLPISSDDYKNCRDNSNDDTVISIPIDISVPEADVTEVRVCSH
jgi:hypothetical protein